METQFWILKHFWWRKLWQFDFNESLKLLHLLHLYLHLFCSGMSSVTFELHLWGYTCLGNSTVAISCLLMWPWRLLFLIAEKLQTVHFWGFSPVCLILCFFRYAAWLVEWLHCVHLCSFSPLWISKCFFSFPASRNNLLHCTQVCGFSPVCVRVWVLRLSARVVE